VAARAVGYNVEDTWEWDPATGAWTNVSTAGSHPSARSQHAMVYEKSTGKIFLFGGGRSDPNSSDGTGVSVSLGDAWEMDPATHAWTAVSATGGPSVRHDFGMVWDATRAKAVLFGGMQTDIANATGVPKQDTWEFDPAASAWTERTAPGSKPSQRYAHAMAFDGSRGKAVVFGGWDISTGGFLSDLWDWDPTSGAWTERLSDSSAAGPAGRLYASMISIDASARIEIVAGAINSNPYGPYGTGGSYIGPLPSATTASPGRGRSGSSIPRPRPMSIARRHSTCPACAAITPWRTTRQPARSTSSAATRAT